MSTYKGLNLIKDGFYEWLMSYGRKDLLIHLLDKAIEKSIERSRFFGFSGKIADISESFRSFLHR